MNRSERDYYIVVFSSQEYNMNTISKELELPGAFLLGAAGGASRIVGMNAEVNHFYPHHTADPDYNIFSLRALKHGLRVQGCSSPVLPQERKPQISLILPE